MTLAAEQIDELEVSLLLLAAWVWLANAFDRLKNLVRRRLERFCAREVAARTPWAMRRGGEYPKPRPDWLFRLASKLEWRLRRKRTIAKHPTYRRTKREIEKKLHER